MYRFLALVGSIVFICGLSVAQSQPLQLTVSSNKPVFPAQEFDLTFKFTDGSGSVVTDFEMNHEKFNHTIIVSKDLEVFAHIHPDQRKDGLFKITLNGAQASDADNVDASQAIAKPGTYLLFSEVTPKGAAHSVVATSEIVAHGKDNFVQLVPDISLKNKIIKYFKANGDAGIKGDIYKVTLTQLQMTGMIHFYFKIEEWMEMGGSGHYMTVSNLEPWLGMPGHGILISESGTTASTKVFHHLHAMAEGGNDDHHVGHRSRDGGHNHPPANVANVSGENLEMALSGQDVPPPGIYKLWGQFKHNGQILTFPFILDL